VSECIGPLINSALDGGEWSASRSGPFTPRERAPGTHWIEGWVDLRAGLHTVTRRKYPFIKTHPKTYRWLHTNTIKKNTEALLEANREVGLEVNTDETKYMLMFRHQNTG
jgi:hypothetical protein